MWPVIDSIDMKGFKDTSADFVKNGFGLVRMKHAKKECKKSPHFMVSSANSGMVLVRVVDFL